MHKRILVTGGAGFLGSHLCERLLANRHDVICLDNLFTGRTENVRHLVQTDGFEFVRQDVCEPFRAEVDEIYHMACPASPVHYQKNPVRTIQTCVQGTLHALMLAREVGAKLLIASTSEVYGDPVTHPQVESYWGNVNPVGPRACYDEGKRCAESLAIAFSTQYGVKVRIPRIFNTYGPRMLENDGRVISNFVVQCLRNQPMTIYGDGTQTRSFCYVSDLIEGLVSLMESDVEGPVNLGNPKESTMIEIATLVRSLVGGTSEVTFLPLPTDDPTRRKPDITRARKELDWEPVVALEDGLARTISAFRERPKRVRWEKTHGSGEPDPPAGTQR
jgi:UDP-glucuronate decarboxylase